MQKKGEGRGQKAEGRRGEGRRGEGRRGEDAGTRGHGELKTQNLKLKT
ncbi:hypothetical protein K9N68_16625 [Kovacikia minuta CCNUW1]|nr:hypothetical protein [Kovacikia minuta]UBF29310.1 hypothetical protein K9N68_16625 [Kovacikia minuta CCNUW1]